MKACVWSGSRVEEAWAIVEEAEAAATGGDSSFASKDLLDARLVLVQVNARLTHSPGFFLLVLFLVFF